eukprot:5082609-Prymnesium_polylepis.1
MDPCCTPRAPRQRPCTRTVLTQAAPDRFQPRRPRDLVGERQLWQRGGQICFEWMRLGAGPGSPLRPPLHSAATPLSCDLDEGWREKRRLDREAWRPRERSSNLSGG